MKIKELKVYDVYLNNYNDILVITERGIYLLDGYLLKSVSNNGTIQIDQITYNELKEILYTDIPFLKKDGYLLIC